MDNQSFYGGILHVCYAPEYENVQDTREKLQDRRKTVAAKIRRLESDEGRSRTQTPSTSSLASSEEWAYRTQQFGKQQQQKQPSLHQDHQPSSTQQQQHHSLHNVPPPQHDQSQQHPTFQQFHTHHHTQPLPQHAHSSQHQQQWEQSVQQHGHETIYPPLPPPPQNPPPFNPEIHHVPLNSASGTHLTHPGNDRPNMSKVGPLGEVVIREYQNKSVPKFVPRQIKSSVKPKINKNLLGKILEKKDDDSVNKGDGKGITKDKVNEALKMESFVLRSMQGPMLPEAEEERRVNFKLTESGSESVDQTINAIRKRVQEFSSVAPPPQLKRKRKT